MLNDNTNYLQEHADFLQLMMNAHVNKPTEEDMADEELSHSIKFGDGDVWTTKGLANLFIISFLPFVGNLYIILMCYEMAKMVPKL